MATPHNALRAGLFIVCSVIGIGVILYWVSGAASVSGKMQDRSIVFALADNIGGLRMGDNVRIGGYTVGIVKSIELRQPADGKAEPVLVVVASLPAKYVLREGASPQAESTVTGQASLNFVSLGTGKELADGTEIAGKPSGFSDLLTSAKSLTPTIKHALETIDTKTLPAVNEDLAKFGGAADEIKKLAGSVGEKWPGVADGATVLVKNVDGLVTSVREKTLPNVEAATGTLKDKLPGVMDSATALLVKGKESLTLADKALTEATATFSNTRGVTGDVKDVVATNKSRLSEIISSLHTASDNLKYATTEIRHSPWRLLYKPTAGEVANLNLYDTARQFAEGAAALQDAAEAVNDAAKVKDLPAKDMQALMDHLHDTFEKFQVVEKKLYDGVK